MLHIDATARAVVLHTVAAARAVVLHSTAWRSGSLPRLATGSCHRAWSFSETRGEASGRLDSNEARVTLGVDWDHSWAAGPFSWPDKILVAAKIRFF